MSNREQVTLKQNRRSPKFYLTNELLASIQPADKEFTLLDSAVSGFGLRVRPASSRNPKGCKTFVISQMTGTRQTKIVLGTFPSIDVDEARQLAMNARQRLEDGESAVTIKCSVAQGLEILPGSSLTVDQVMRRYISDYAKVHTVNWKNAERNWKKHGGPLANRSVNRLTPMEIQGWLNALGTTLSGASANRCFNDLRAAIRWAMRMRLIRIYEDPTKFIKQFFEEGRSRWLKQKEWERLKQVLSKNPGDCSDAILLIFATAARKNNVLSMRWDELDLSEGIWTVPPKKSKSRKRIVIPLTELAKEILNARRFIARGSEWVFPSRQSPTGHMTNIDHIWRVYRKEAGLDDVHLHDIRHTVGSWLGMSGASAFMIQQALGHSNVATTQRYTHLDKEAIRRALESVQR